MIVVKIELHHASRPGKITEIGRMRIINTGSNADRPQLGNYTVNIFKRGQRRKVVRWGSVENYPRMSYNVWRLVSRAILSAFPEEKRRCRDHKRGVSHSYFQRVGRLGDPRSSLGTRRAVGASRRRRPEALLAHRLRVLPGTLPILYRLLDYCISCLDRAPSRNGSYRSPAHSHFLVPPRSSRT